MSGEDDRLRRQAANERLLREANWETALLNANALPPAADDEELVFHCACGRTDCAERVALSVAAYADAHRRPHRFIVVPGHVTPELERVVERHPRYTVVEKRPAYQASGEPPPGALPRSGHGRAPEPSPAIGASNGDNRLSRAEQNELAFKRHNERRVAIEEAAGLWEDEPAPFVCECDDPDCGRAIELPIGEYERAAAPGDQFIVKPGHEDLAVEEVVERHPGYFVVSKPDLRRPRRS